MNNMNYVPTNVKSLPELPSLVCSSVSADNLIQHSVYGNHTITYNKQEMENSKKCELETKKNNFNNLRSDINCNC